MTLRSTLLVAMLCGAFAACTAMENVASSSEATNTPTGSTSTTPSSSSATVAPARSTTTTPAVTDVRPIDLGPLEPRGGHSVIWTGEEMIVWGGEANENGSMLFSDGAAYDPDNDKWRLIAPASLSARRYHVAAWTGEEMLVVGGVDERDGAAYDSETDIWRSIAESPIPIGPLAGAPIEGVTGWVWTGAELVLWHVPTDEVAAYRPDIDEWSMLPRTRLGGDTGVLRWSGDAVYAFAATTRRYSADNELRVSRLGDRAWDPLPSAEFSTEALRVGAVPKLTVWAGDRLVAWSGEGYEGKTLAFRPADGTWTDIADILVPPCEAQGEPVEADGKVFAFGWCGPNTAIFDPDSDEWSSVPIAGYPTARYTVWTGTELLNWGDTCCYGTGGTPFRVDAWRYSPSD